jgi:hypothetical protein
MHANEGSSETTFNNHHIRFYRGVSTGKNTGRIYGFD